MSEIEDLTNLIKKTEKRINRTEKNLQQDKTALKTFEEKLSNLGE